MHTKGELICHAHGDVQVRILLTQDLGCVQCSQEVTVSGCTGCIELNAVRPGFYQNGCDMDHIVTAELCGLFLRFHSFFDLTLRKQF